MGNLQADAATVGQAFTERAATDWARNLGEARKERRMTQEAVDVAALAQKQRDESEHARVLESESRRMLDDVVAAIDAYRAASGDEIEVSRAPSNLAISASKAAPPAGDFTLTIDSGEHEVRFATRYSDGGHLYTNSAKARIEMRDGHIRFVERVGGELTREQLVEFWLTDFFRTI